MFAHLLRNTVSNPYLSYTTIGLDTRWSIIILVTNTVQTSDVSVMDTYKADQLEFSINHIRTMLKKYLFLTWRVMGY